MKLFIGADHRGFALKEKIKKYLDQKNLPYEDLGSLKYNKTDDYPDFAKKVAEKVSKGSRNKGVLLCGSGAGVCIVANKFPGVRAVNTWNKKIARLSRKDDDSNILCLPADLINEIQAKQIINEWLKTPFSKAMRHHRRLRKIKKIEKSL